MAVTLKGQTAVYEGTSTDTKPTDADNNSIFKELDTGIRYYYDGTDWNEIPSSGGGGGGGTGTDNYNELHNKPSINGTTLSGNKSLDNLGIQAKLTFDSAPTEDSENPVKSGGVYSALAGKQDALSSEQLAAVNSGIDSTKVAQIETNKNNILLLEQQSKWNYTETRFTNAGTSDFENTGVSFTVPTNQSVEFYAYDRKDGAYLDKILVCDSLTTIGNTTIISANSIIGGFTDAQYWTLQTAGIVPTFNSDVTYYIWVKRKSTGANPVGLAWRYVSQ